ncbi:MAG TPA: hypothetical protein PLV21_17345 [Cyclobacteriaceae bacterium]|nr:hypothetical protein [Cyclobacteriaceae bacterium]HRJ83654.1 hypothetical protein [Cyclobacteriaceae bacterium]
MKPITYISLVFALFACTTAFTQNKSSTAVVSELTIEPGVGVHTNFGTDFLVTNLIQWNPTRRFSLGAHTSFNYNNISQRDFNYVKTNYNYSINQKFGAGTTFYSKKSSHTFLLMVGFKYTAFKETLYNPDFDKVSVAIKGFSPDYGLMYSYKKGLKKCFFTFRMYIPLYPWPVKGSDIDYIDGNRDNIALELGIGVRIK